MCQLRKISLEIWSDEESTTLEKTRKCAQKLKGVVEYQYVLVNWDNQRKIETEGKVEGVKIKK